VQGEVHSGKGLCDPSGIDLRGEVPAVAEVHDYAEPACATTKTEPAPASPCPTTEPPPLTVDKIR
jgi:hypothetical protein